MSVLLQDEKFAISCFITILGILISIYIYYISIRYRQIAYCSKTVSISSKTVIHNIDLKLSYKNKPLDELSYTDLIIWAKGKTLINNTDVAPLAPLTVNVSEDTEILDYQIIAQNEAANNFELSKDDHKIIINFDYLSYKNGIAVRIIHTGDENSVSVNCKLKEGRDTIYVCERKGFLYKFMEHQRIRAILSNKITSLIAIIFTIFLFPSAFVQSGNYSNNNFFNLPNISIFASLDSLIIFILCLTSFILAVPHVYNLFKAEPPKELGGYDFDE